MTFYVHQTTCGTVARCFFPHPTHACRASAGGNLAPATWVRQINATVKLNTDGYAPIRTHSMPWCHAVVAYRFIGRVLLRLRHELLQ